MLCLATAIHNFTWVKMTNICLIWDRTFTNLHVWAFLLAQFSLYVHKGGLKPDSFHLNNSEDLEELYIPQTDSPTL